jgi:hypothetical protein
MRIDTFTGDTMPQLKLNYFDFHGGRAEPVRLALHIGGIAFEDHRFTFPEFAEFRTLTAFVRPCLSVGWISPSRTKAVRVRLTVSNFRSSMAPMSSLEKRDTTKGSASG